MITVAIVMARTPRAGTGDDSIPLRFGAGFLSGSIGSSTSLGGPPIVLYLLGRGGDNASFRATVMAFFLPANLLIVLAFAVVGRLTGDVLLLSAISLPGIGLGIIAGGRVRRLPTPDTFHIVVLGVLIATSAAVLTGAAVHLA